MVLSLLCRWRWTPTSLIWMNTSSTSSSPPTWSVWLLRRLVWDVTLSRAAIANQAVKASVGKNNEWHFVVVRLLSLSPSPSSSVEAVSTISFFFFIFSTRHCLASVASWLPTFMLVLSLEKMPWLMSASRSPSTWGLRHLSTDTYALEPKVRWVTAAAPWSKGLVEFIFSQLRQCDHFIFWMDNLFFWYLIEIFGLNEKRKWIDEITHYRWCYQYVSSLLQ